MPPARRQPDRRRPPRPGVAEPTSSLTLKQRIERNARYRRATPMGQQLGGDFEVSPIIDVDRNPIAGLEPYLAKQVAWNANCVGIPPRRNSRACRAAHFQK